VEKVSENPFPGGISGRNKNFYGEKFSGNSKKKLFFSLQGAVAKQIRDIPGLNRVNIFKLLCL